VRSIVNNFVSFVSDEDFLECVQYVCDAYSGVTDEKNFKRLKRNTIDPFKVLFDVFNSKTSLKSWLKNESIRQIDKTINNRIGEFHQKLLGKVKGWTDLGTGHKSRVDLKKDDNSIFIELKNKHNTMNSDATKECRHKLEKAVASNPGAVAYWAYIVTKNGISEEHIWKIKDFPINERIRTAHGSKVYEIVTGNPKALSETWKALPEALKTILKNRHEISESDNKNILKLFDSAFKS